MIVVDYVHVLEYLWDAAWCFFAEGDPAAEAWVGEKALAVLEGKAGTRRRRDQAQGDVPHTRRGAYRKNADTCANYLRAKARYLDYPTALAAADVCLT